MREVGKAEMARIILKSTPGVVADRIFCLHGLSYKNVKDSLIARRSRGLGWKLKL